MKALLCISNLSCNIYFRYFAIFFSISHSVLLQEINKQAPTGMFRLNEALSTMGSEVAVWSPCANLRSSHLAGRKWLIVTSMQTTEVLWWKCCLVWKESRLKELCHTGSRGCGSGAWRQAVSASLRQQMTSLISDHLRGSSHEWKY